MRVIYVKVGKVAPERRKVWRDLATDCQRATNMVWRMWEQWHCEQGSAAKIKRQLDHAKTGKKTKDGVACLDKALSKRTYDALAREFPGVGSRCRVLLQNIVNNKIKHHPGTTKLPGWMSILLDYDGRPTTRKAAPVPFDSANASLHRTADGKGLVLRLRIDRNEVPGRKNGASTVDEVPLYIAREKEKYVAPLFDIADGKIKFVGSQLVWLPNLRTWKVAIAYDAPSKVAAVDKNKVLVIRPGKKRPWRMRVNGKSTPCGGRWKHVAHKRSSLLGSRFGRAENYRWADRNAKGRGRQRGIADFTKLAQNWRMFCNSNNRQFADKVKDLAIAMGCGKIVYVQWVESEDEAPSRYLSAEGQIERSNSTRWPWHELGTLLKNKANPCGIEVVVTKTRRSEHVETCA